MIIRKAEIADAEGIAKVHVDSWRTTYKGIIPDEYLENLSYEKRVMMWKSILSAESNELFENLIVHVAENETGEIVGFVSGGKKQDAFKDYKGELSGIYLLKEYQRHGIGHRIVAAFVQSLLDINVENMLVWFLAENSAKLFYEKLGGREICKGKIVIGKELNSLAYGWKNIRVILNDTDPKDNHIS